MMSKSAKYIPALRFDWLTPLYDPLLRWVMHEETIKRQLIRQADIQPGQQVLDLGCGTATLTILIKQSIPEAEVVGLDGDPKVLEIARSKAARAGVNLVLDQGMAYQLLYPDGSFDRILSSLVLHHLASDDKRKTMREVYRVLRPGGEFHVLDFGKPHSLYGSLLSPVMKRLEQASDNVRGLLPVMMREAGFELVEESAYFTTIFGSLSLYRGCKSDEGGQQ
jgi:ubiquinone/menaquinone biosynthesis C-methylase UbiE